MPYSRNKSSYKPKWSRHQETDSGYPDRADVEPTPSKPSSSRSKPPSKRSRDSVRSENKRIEQGEKEVENLSKRLKEKLYPGFLRLADLVSHSGVVAVPALTRLPISSRVLGISTQYYFQKFHTLFPRDDIDPSLSFAYYRLSLLQFEYKMYLAYSQTTVNQYNVPPYHPNFLTAEYQIAASSYNVGFSATVMMLNSIGNFSHNGCKFVPILAPMGDKIVSETTSTLAATSRESVDTVVSVLRFAPEATTIAFSNLRNVVYAMASKDTPREWRNIFYMHNSLPFAKWSGAPADPILENPSDFWPENYGSMELAKDMRDLRTFFTRVSGKQPKYFASGTVDYKSDGSPDLLVSNNPSCFQMTTELMNYVACEYYSSQPVGDNSFFMGSVFMTGETPALTLYVDGLYAVRTPNIRAESAFTDGFGNFDRLFA